MDRRVDQYGARDGPLDRKLGLIALEHESGKRLQDHDTSTRGDAQRGEPIRAIR